MDSTEHTKMALEVSHDHLPEDPYDAERPQHQGLLLVLDGFYKTYKDLDISPMVALTRPHRLTLRGRVTTV